MKARILLIEDDPASQELVEYLLVAQGHEVICASRGDDGLELARSSRPDLILCDIQLPGLDGYAVAEFIRHDAVLCRTPIIAVTAMAMVGDRERVLSAGFDSYIAKPVDPAHFATAIAPFLRATQHPRRTEERAAREANPAHVVHGTALLAIDDVAANLDLIRSIFEPLGYSVRTAETAQRGLLLAAEQPPRLVICDIDLPDMTGFELLRRLKADPHLRNIPVLVVTATYTDASARQTALAMGATSFLSRPVDPGILISMVEACLKTADEF